MGNNTKQGKDDSILFGREVLVPSSALDELESVHGPHKWLHGKVKVR